MNVFTTQRPAPKRLHSTGHARVRALSVLFCGVLVFAQVSYAQESGDDGSLTDVMVSDPGGSPDVSTSPDSGQLPGVPADDATPMPLVLPTSTPVPLSAADIAARASGSIVQVLTPNGAAGSGVKVSGGIITNEHVVRGVTAVQVIAADGRKANASVVNTDYAADLALLVSDLDLPAMDMESATQLRQGDELLVLGYARPDVIGGQASLSRGLVSAVRQDKDGRLWVQTDAAMNHGDSGGPVLSTRGKLIGVVSFGLVDSQGLNFAVASDTIQAFLGVPWAVRQPPTPTPIPTPTMTPRQRDCAAVASSIPLITSTVQSAATAQAANDYQRLRALASDLRSRTYPTLILPVVNAVLRVLDAAAASAEIRANWPLLVLTASRDPSGNGAYLIAAAQIDLNQDDALAANAQADVSSAIVQLQTTCGK